MAKEAKKAKPNKFIVTLVVETPIHKRTPTKKAVKSAIERPAPFRADPGSMFVDCRGELVPVAVRVRTVDFHNPQGW